MIPVEEMLAALAMEALEAIAHTEAMQTAEAERLAGGIHTERITETYDSTIHVNSASFGASAWPAVGVEDDDFEMDYNAAYQPFRLSRKHEVYDEEKECTPPFESRHKRTRRPSMEPTPFKQLEGRLECGGTAGSLDA